MEIIIRRGSYVKTYAVDVNTSRTSEEGAHIPSWPNVLRLCRNYVYHHMYTIAIWDVNVKASYNVNT